MKIIEAVFALSLVIGLAACTGTAPQRPPSYAIVVGQDNDYEVDCGASLVIVDRYEVDYFFKEDGTAKTRQEFCDEYRGGTRINR